LLGDPFLPEADRGKISFRFLLSSTKVVGWRGEGEGRLGIWGRGEERIKEKGVWEEEVRKEGNRGKQGWREEKERRPDKTYPGPNGSPL
jgi:hypothetical protein